MKRGVWWTLVSLGLFLAVASLVYWDFNNYLENAITKDSDEQAQVVVEQGMTLSEVVTALEEAHVVTSPTYFRLHLLMTDLADKMRAGVYYFNFQQTPKEVAQILSHGPKNPFLVVTIKEGYNLWQVASAFENAGICNAEKILALARDEEFARKAGVPIIPGNKTLFHLEGYVFPETYYVAPGQTPEHILRRMIRQTFVELKEAKKKHLRPYSLLLEEFGFTDHELLTIASLVEKETGLPNEKRLVTSVFLNRLRQGMRLQTDPTLAYTPEKQGRNPTAKDKKNRENLYNTYEYEGLPPGPICNPGRESLEGAVNPGKSGFLFFVAKRDGTGGHHFSTNYDDHRRAVKKYLGTSSSKKK